METQATPHAPAAHPMGKHGHPGARGKAGHSSDAACSMRRMALRQAQEMLGKKIDPWFHLVGNATWRLQGTQGCPLLVGLFSGPNEENTYVFGKEEFILICQFKFEITGFLLTFLTLYLSLLQQKNLVPNKHRYLGYFETFIRRVITAIVSIKCTECSLKM